MIESIVFVAACALAAALGFTAHRASLCSVKAVVEIVTTHRGRMLVSFAKTVLWVIAIEWALRQAGIASTHPRWPFSFAAVLGGFVFGMGAAINRGCAFSTLTRLASGNLGMIATLAGFVLGYAGLVALAPRRFIPSAGSMNGGIELPEGLRWAVTVLLVLWVGRELLLLWRGRPRGASIRQMLAAPRYRLSSAALFIGMSNALLFALFGPWLYTSVLGGFVRERFDIAAAPGGEYFGLAGAIFGGMVLAALLARRVRIDARPSRRWLSYAGGGILMGAGAALVPGGNDVLLLNAIPGFSSHAVPAYAAMHAGIWLAILFARWSGMAMDPVRCEGDVCFDTEPGSANVPYSRSPG